MRFIDDWGNIYRATYPLCILLIKLAKQGIDGYPFAYNLEETDIGQGISISKVSWESEPVIVDPDEILGMGSTSKNPKSDRVVEFLNTLLVHGETSQS